MILLGILCLLYYGAICCLMGKWNATFSRFWLVTGLGCVVLHKSLISIRGILVLLAVVFLIVEIKILSGFLMNEKQGLVYLIVLGAKVNGNVVSESLRRRLDKAAAYLQNNPETLVIVSGGQGKGEFITEAEAMYQYLLAKGIDGSRIQKEDQSSTTKENLIFSKRFLPDHDISVGIVTNNFHVYRSCYYAKRLGYKLVYGIPAGCHPVLFANYMVREFFAVLKMWLFR